MYTGCFESDKFNREGKNKLSCFTSNNIYKNQTHPNEDIKFSNRGKKIPIKIILSENEEVLSTYNSECYENNSSGITTPFPIQNSTENYLKFSNSKINNFSIGII
jgi:hypothetical protein